MELICKLTYDLYDDVGNLCRRNGFFLTCDWDDGIRCHVCYVMS